MDLYSPGVAGCKDSQTENDSFSRRNLSSFFFFLLRELAVNLYNRERSSGEQRIESSGIQGSAALYDM